LGSVGVSFFFTLSGFILAYTYATRPAQPLAFWRARFARIYPIYIASLLFAAPAFLGALTRYSRDGGSLPALAARFVTLSQSWTVSSERISAPPLLNNPSGSRSTEAFFYLVFPLVIWAAVKLPLRTFLVAAFGLGAVLLRPQR